ncbi:MAG: hypothetical protein Q9170_004102, partial [Blastenia crenularia]
MNIVCPPGSYDANVEPAKDDVLFNDSRRILELVEVFFKSHYGDLKVAEKQSASGKHATARPRAFDLLLARRPPATDAQLVAPDTTNECPSSPTLLQGIEKAASCAKLPGQTTLNGQDQRNTHEASPREPSLHHNKSEAPVEAEVPLLGAQSKTAQSWRRSMYPEDEDEELESGHTVPSEESEDEENLRGVTVTNPWTLAKINAPIRPLREREGTSNDISSIQQLPTPAKGPGDLSQDLSPPDRILVPTLPTPAKSQIAPPNEQSSPDTFLYPRRAWGKTHREADSSPNRSSSSDERPPPSSSILDTWVQRTPAQPHSADQDLFLSTQDPFPSTQDPFPTRLHISPSQGTPLSTIPNFSHKPRRKQPQRTSNVNKPFTPPVRDLTRVWFDQHEPSSRSTQPRRSPQKASAADNPIRSPSEGRSDPIVSSSSSSPSVAPQSITPSSIHPGLALTLDYEKRKADAVAARRAFLRQQQPSNVNLPSSPRIKISPSQQSSVSSPHQNRYRAAVVALHTPPNNQPDTQSIDPKDPRAKLMRFQMGGVKRVKT